MKSWVISTIHGEKIHQGGNLGQNITIAFLDTGLFPHRDFSPRRILSFTDMINQRICPYDDNGHGTHITGIAASAHYHHNYLGIAPWANIVMVKVLDAQGNGSPYALAQGISWVHEHYKEYQIRIVNISIGTVDLQDDASVILLDYVNQLWDDGLVVCIAGGNQGPRTQSICVPGNSHKVITVGSSDDHLYTVDIQGNHRHYSGRGPTRGCVMKPDVVAPGTNLYSTLPGNTYGYKSGTSMATPVVSGAIALYLYQYPYASNKRVKMKLRTSCDSIHTSKYHQGWGQINVKRLLNEK